MSGDGVVAGNAIVFHVTMTLRAGWNFMDVVTSSNLSTGVKGIGARIINPGAVTYFPPEWAVRMEGGNRGAKFEKKAF